MVLNTTPIRQRVFESARTSVLNGEHRLEFQAMASRCHVTFEAPPAAAKEFQRAALTWVADFEATYSRFLPDSLISRINALAGKTWVDIDPETERLLALCHEAYQFTRGVFDPTALPLLQLWNWKATPPTLPTEEAIRAAKLRVGWPKVHRAPGKIFLPEGMCLDLGGIGKEFAVDQVAALAAQLGIRNVLVDFGQDVLACGTPSGGRPAWHIGLEDPEQPGKCWTGVAVKDAAVATSGDYVRRFEINGRRYGHIIDVRSGWPVANGCRSVSVIAPSCAMAGMLSTTIFVLGPEEGARLLDFYPGVAGCIITDRSRVASRKFYEHTTS